MENTIYSSQSQYPQKGVYTPNGRAYIPASEYRRVAKYFHVAYREHFVLWFTGAKGRHGRTERMLKRLSERGQLKRARHGKPFVYWSPDNWRKKPDNIEHGLMSTEGLIRFMLSEKGIPIRERSFKGMHFRVIPEWGIDYNGKLLLFEYGTEDNFYYLPRKINRYKDNLYRIEYAFTGNAVVLFVLDTTRDHLIRYLNDRMPIGEEFYFCDKSTFLSVKLGEQLTADIYISGVDGESYPLKND